MGKENVKAMKSSKKHTGFIIDELVDDIVSSVTSPPFSTTKWTCTTMSVEQRKDPSIKTCLVHIQRSWLGSCNLFVIKVHNCRKPVCEHIICNPDCETRTIKESAKKKIKNNKKVSRIVKEVRNGFINYGMDDKENILNRRKEKCQIKNNTRIVDDFSEENNVESSNLDQPVEKKKPSCTLQIFSEGKARKLNFLLHPAMEAFLGKALDKIQGQNVKDTIDRKKTPTIEGKNDRTLTTENIKQKRSSFPNKKNVSNLFHGQTPVRVTASMEEFEIKITDEKKDGSNINDHYDDSKLKIPHKRKTKKKKNYVSADSSIDRWKQQKCDNRQNNFEKPNSYQKIQNDGRPKGEKLCHPSKKPTDILVNQMYSYVKKKNDQTQEDKNVLKKLYPKPLPKNNRKESYSEHMAYTDHHQVSQERSRSTTENMNSNDNDVFNNLINHSRDQIMINDQAETKDSSTQKRKKDIISVYHTNESVPRSRGNTNTRVSHDGPTRCTFLRDGPTYYTDFHFEAHKEPVRDSERITDNNVDAGFTEEESEGHSRLTNDEHEGTWYDAYDHLEEQNNYDTAFEDAVDRHDLKESILRENSVSRNSEVIAASNRPKNSLFKKRLSNKDAEGNKKSVEESPKLSYRKYSTIKVLNDVIPSNKKVSRLLSRREKSISRKISNDVPHQRNFSKNSQIDIDDEIIAEEQVMEREKGYVSCNCNRSDVISCKCDQDLKAHGRNSVTKPVSVMTDHLNHSPKNSIHNHQSSCNDVFKIEGEPCDNEIQASEDGTNGSQHSFKLYGSILKRTSIKSGSNPRSSLNSVARDFSHQSPTQRRDSVQHQQRTSNDIFLDNVFHTDRELEDNRTTGNKLPKLSAAKLNVKTPTKHPHYYLSQKIKTGNDSEEEYFYEKQKVIKKSKYKNTGKLPTDIHNNYPNKNVRKVISDVSSLSKKDMVYQRKTPKGKHTIINKTISIETLEGSDYIVVDQDNNQSINDEKSSESVTLYRVDQNEVCEQIHKEDIGCRISDERFTENPNEILIQDNSRIIAMEYCCVGHQDKSTLHECYDQGERWIGNNCKYHGEKPSSSRETQKKVRNFPYNERKSEFRNKRKINSDETCYCEIHSKMPEKDKTGINSHSSSIHECNQHNSNYPSYGNNISHNVCPKCVLQEEGKGVNSASADKNCIYCQKNSDFNSLKNIERKSISSHSENEKNCVNHAGPGKHHCNRVKNMSHKDLEENCNLIQTNKMETRSNVLNKYFKGSTGVNCMNLSTDYNCSCSNKLKKSDVAIQNPEIYIVYPGPVPLNHDENNNEKLNKNSPSAQGYVVAYSVEPTAKSYSDSGEQCRSNQITRNYIPNRDDFEKDEFKILPSDSDCENNLAYGYNNVNFDSDIPSEIDKSKNWVTEYRRNKPRLCSVPTKLKSNSLLSLLSNYQNRKPMLRTFAKENKSSNKNECIDHLPTLSATIAINPIQPTTNTYSGNDFSSANVNVSEGNHYRLHTSCLSNTIKNNYKKIKVMMKRNSSKQLCDSAVSSESKFEHVQYTNNFFQNDVSSSSINVFKQKEEHCNHFNQDKAECNENSKTKKPSSSSSRSESILRRFQPLWYKAFSGRGGKVRPKSLETDLTGNMETERIIGGGPDAIGEKTDSKMHYVELRSGSGLSFCEECSKVRDSTNQCSKCVFIRNQKETSYYQTKPEYLYHSDEHPMTKLQGNWFQDPFLDPTTGFNPVLPK